MDQRNKKDSLLSVFFVVNRILSLADCLAEKNRQFEGVGAQINCQKAINR